MYYTFSFQIASNILATAKIPSAPPGIYLKPVVITSRITALILAML